MRVGGTRAEVRLHRHVRLSRFVDLCVTGASNMHKLDTRTPVQGMLAASTSAGAKRSLSRRMQVQADLNTSTRDRTGDLQRVRLTS